MRAVLGILTVLLTAGLTVGCDATTGGMPSAAPSNGADPTSPATSSTDTSELPRRPRDIDLAGLNPCVLWTSDQLDQLAVEREPVAGGPQQTAAGHMSCAYLSAAQSGRDVRYDVTLVTDQDATTKTGTTVESSVVEVEGFPGVQKKSDSSTMSPCELEVSTASGQHLEVLAMTRDDVSVQQACEMTLKAATFAVQTLKTLR